jgi:hypothetical protein
MTTTMLKDGSKVQLPCGWKLEICARDDGSLQGFINKGQQSASLAFALETGIDSHNDEPIPAQVLKALEEYRDYE